MFICRNPSGPSGKGCSSFPAEPSSRQNKRVDWRCIRWVFPDILDQKGHLTAGLDPMCGALLGSIQTGQSHSPNSGLMSGSGSEHTGCVAFTNAFACVVNPCVMALWRNPLQTTALVQATHPVYTNRASEFWIREGEASQTEMQLLRHDFCARLLFRGQGIQLWVEMLLSRER